MLLKQRLCKEVIFIKILETDTNVEGLFIAIQQFFKEKDVMLENILCASSKVGKYKGFWPLYQMYEERDRVNQSAYFSSCD